ncbi:MAG TPA: methyltransferase domain-containing protein [Candidatus Ozemobacteraceae bacterium]|nr:methyltransferase domain-containing protein [Candidatus Ozemobacteraceae bacterium]
MGTDAPDVWKSGALVEHYNTLFPFDEQEILEYLAPLELGPDDVFIDFGCGNGSALSIAAKLCRRAVGVDIARQQLDIARKRLETYPNVKLLELPFLDCRLEGETFTRGSSRKALHHLTDPEKFDFFALVGKRFAPGSRFVIEDAVFDFPRSRLGENMAQVLADAEQWYGERWSKVREDVLITLREEFATGIDAWEEALRAGGFRIAERRRRTCFLSHLTAIKEG